MATQASNNSSAAPDAASTTLGVGGTTSGQAGATPQHETQQETGGSGGEQLTQSTGEIASAPGQEQAQAQGTPPPASGPAPEADGSAVQSGARGAQDTRAQQAGGTGTGLGTPETGANQSEDDLPPAR
jgi:hypothetical protein